MGLGGVAGARKKKPPDHLQPPHGRNAPNQPNQLQRYPRLHFGRRGVWPIGQFVRQGTPCQLVKLTLAKSAGGFTTPQQLIGMVCSIRAAPPAVNQPSVHGELVAGVKQPHSHTHFPIGWNQPCLMPRPHSGPMHVQKESRPEWALGRGLSG